MLNGTLCATERALCCLVENYQTAEVRRAADGYMNKLTSRVSGYQKLCNPTCKVETSFLTRPSCREVRPAPRRSDLCPVRLGSVYIMHATCDMAVRCRVANAFWAPDRRVSR